MIGLALKLLGIGKMIREFFAANWKWLLPLIAAVLLALFVWRWHTNSVKQAFADGVAYEHSLQLKRIDEENARNRAFETRLEGIVTTSGQVAAEKAAELVAEQDTHVNTIKTIITHDVKYEQCLLDQSVVDEINTIRGMGPK